jgi:hypothetical protein
MRKPARRAAKKPRPTPARRAAARKAPARRRVPAARAAARPVDLLGRPADAVGAEVLRLYRDTRRLCGRDDLPPFLARNLRKSLACLYQGVNGLFLEFEHLYDIGV